MSIECIEMGTFAEPTAVSEQLQELRVVSWNIARGAQMDAIREFLISAKADLILLQESDRNSRRTAHRNVARELAETLRMNYVFGIEFQELGQGSHASPAYHGQATLARWPLVDPRILRFRRQSRYWHPRWWIPPLSVFQRRLGGRMALVTRILIGQRRIISYNLHLESRHHDEHRRCQLAELVEDARQYDSDMIVVAGGDFNFDITGPTETAILRDGGLGTPFTKLDVPTIVPGLLGNAKAIDWVLTRGVVAPMSPQIHNSIRASDHYPLSLTLKFS
jgi:endonuclease/exonuclease/phosphatase family metal-dependent hydrolase